ncbi:transferase hexapeptide repeat family protein [Denitrobaculum tricleocarpae]|uniref:Phenylacetic acid degradation protein PaaY n=1 Tax=Denitrobaculum tricleocarpae TaxID=2591009 RepID=A0A545TES5_9PROT|nr:transferase hexapeptide repeat family protein [Denitrobaculum tricleocarpae]TQV75728.1 phenylacetic acid degradation protein PaaY [Denitrobaculum tricleocarpae]
MDSCYEIDGMIPVVDPTAFVHSNAILIGDVIIGPGCYIGPAASLRGDFGRIVVQEGANVQDTCVVHGFPGVETVIGPDGHIGHGAVIHGAQIGRNVLVGMNAVVMDRAEIGESSIIGAAAFVPEGKKIPARSLAVGTPARILRELTDQEIDWKSRGTAEYQQLTRRSMASMKKVQPLTEIEANRPCYEDSSYQTLGQTK